MGNYYFLAFLCCLVAFACIAAWFTERQKKKPKPAPKPSSVPKIIDAEPLVKLVKDYSYDNFTDNNNFLLSKLKKVCLYDPRERSENEMDRWFRNNTPLIIHDGFCLAYIDHYGHLEDTFWKNIKMLGLKIEDDEVFQSLIISVCKTDLGLYHLNLPNMLFHFGYNYKLLLKLEQIVMDDIRFASARATYENAQKYALKDKQLKMKYQSYQAS